MIPVNWWALAGILGLIVAGVLVIVASDPRRKEGAMGRHSWITERDLEPDDADTQASTTAAGPSGERTADEEASAATDVPDDDQRGSPS